MEPNTQPSYRAVPAQLDLPAMEHEILDFWRDDDTFEKSLAQTAEGQSWAFFEGPPTANGQPGTHHVEARVFKDVFPRFKTMQGFRVERKAGWDCHGLPVELAVEKELGLDGKNEIEAYGIEAFNAKCRESVSEHVDEFAELTQRMGYWVNLNDAYWTMNTSYVESVWWALKQIFDQGLLSEDYRVTPYCPRDQTTLSDHEVSQGYEDVTDPAVTVRMRLTSGPYRGRADLLVWTTTPWTLVSNTAVAVHPEVKYVVAEAGDDRVIVAEPLFEQVLGSAETPYRIIDSFVGADLEHWTYQRPFEILAIDGSANGAASGLANQVANYVVLADYVTTSDGTGLVHQAPAFGADDMAVAREYGLPVVNPVRRDGTFEERLPLVGGQFFKTADAALVEDLKRRSLLFRLDRYEHSYPHCWRCGTPLIYYAQPSWYIRTTKIKDALLRENEHTTWYPSSIKDGRFGDWLQNNVDWALSRTRYWGTPLPIWRNDIDPSQMVCVGSLAQLGELAGRDLSQLDPHRPYVDDITFTLDGVAGTFVRVEEVIDAWFDSGSMPFAQLGYPWVEGSKERLAGAYPADFIAEAIDQTRGWFYTLMAVGTLVFNESSYRNVLCLGHILAEDGRKMSKHLGNILLPIPLMEHHGADALRWFMACAGSPWSARRVGAQTLQEVVRKVLLTYWNTVAFQSLYARANDWTPSGEAPKVSSRQVLDRWLVSETQLLVREVTQALSNFDTQHAGQIISTFVDNLSNWYVRRSRRRFWDGDPSALWTLHEALNVLTKVMAPLTPFITERVWQDLFVSTDPSAPSSVHLATWPVSDEALVDAELSSAMALTRRLVEVGRAARAEARVKTRQPLSRALISSTSNSQLTDELRDEIMAELNLGAIDTFAAAGDVVEYSAKGNFRALGKRFGKQTPLVADAISNADAAKLAGELNASGQAALDVNGGVVVSADEVIIVERPRDGWSVANEQGETMALSLEMTPELVRAGLAREVIRFVQETRKTSGLLVSDRIRLGWFTERNDLAQAIKTHEEFIAAEVLAKGFVLAQDGEGWVSDDELGLSIKVTKC